MPRNSLHDRAFQAQWVVGLGAPDSASPLCSFRATVTRGRVILDGAQREVVVLRSFSGTTPNSGLVQQLRDALVLRLSQGTWKEIEEDHAKVELSWRLDLGPGSGKPKYVERVLNELPDHDIIALGRRTLARLHGPYLLDVEDALYWLDANGVAHISEVTRIALARAFDGWRLHPTEGPRDFLSRFASGSTDMSRFEYASSGELVEMYPDILAFFGTGTSPAPPPTKSSHLKLLDAHRFRTWPDRRLVLLLETVVHPTTRVGAAQASLVQTLNRVLVADRFELSATEVLSGHPVFTVRPISSVSGRPKNLIFASNGPKPELGFADAVNNDIVILRHAEHCLVYDKQIGADGLRWLDLVRWWAARENVEEAQSRKQLGARLSKSLGSEPERRFFAAYFKALSPLLGDALPALLPQVYLHYDPVTLRELRERGVERRFDVQRMDFLLLLAHNVRVVIEVDGQQHYATGTDPSAKPSPAEYARTTRSDRNLRLLGYEVYRFGGYELRDDQECLTLAEEFFVRLFRKHQVLMSTPR